MSDSVKDIMEKVYDSIHNDNQDIDARIAELKIALASAGDKSVTVDPARLVQNNRQGRKMMQSYFKKRGVEVVFGD